MLKRGADRGESVIDLIDERPRARAWTRGMGRERDAGDVPLQRLAARQNHRPLPVALGALGGGLDYDIQVPPDAVFRAGVGYRGLVSVDHQYLHPKGTPLSVSIGRDGRFERVVSKRIDDAPRAGRRWTPVEADLSPWAGQRVTLRLEVEAHRPIQGDRVAWWGSPRIVVPPPAADAQHQP